jgi:cell division protein FtsN
MIALFSFSLGVERGRTAAAQSLDEKVTAAWNVGGRRLAVVPAVPQAVKPAAKSVLPHTTVVAKTNFAKTVPVTAVVSSTANRWTVQVATYKSESYAQQEALGLKNKGFDTFIIKSKDFYLVCVGHLASQGQADSFFQKIQAKYKGSQVRRF